MTPSEEPLPEPSAYELEMLAAFEQALKEKEEKEAEEPKPEEPKKTCLDIAYVEFSCELPEDHKEPHRRTIEWP